ncbi:CGNR zinc finger domain-containing protein [Actinomadura madurae]|uniref:CGNR zinc finger domain-containing protein n=1 Tax=Actinomadura madurae TaxID=1993 RepID=UPI00202763C0|nr:CGNR zinc finger domain-containing protein [Actinomadura madurae]MCP9951532.1 CGNR zinc finger domain-containing protein [Actinomadura madurae]MCP9968306.1 CGNR zinc finger domain-containing protein [Actinomadura madurae]MCP9980770.1 CGNR zinc finger domain-containing protein [Actinomadura madurae]MCQ0007730.1 CGNR zinc finger domain-containing protein [Actinomadura madurae]MCQ0016964.1 CGNR zinc finger domain-containing protein [Actinomadura madurae]
MRYVAYIGNLTRLAVELVNGDEPSGLRREFFRQHHIAEPDAGELEGLLGPLREAVASVADGGPIAPVNLLLERFPPVMHVSEHDGEGQQHLHFGRDGEEPVAWLGRSCAAALAHAICGDPEVAVGRCRAEGCARFYVDDSRNRSRRFCSNTCASRTTVANYRARRKAATTR